MNILATITAYKAIQNDIDNKEKELAELKEKILAYMGEKTEIVVGQYKATNKDISKHDIDRKALQENFPEIAKQFEKIITYKRFIVK